MSGASPWAVEIRAISGSPAVFTLTTTDANTALASVTVECDADAVLTINESSTGTFATVGDVVEANSSSPESFEIRLIDISGSLGSEVVNENTVAAEVISEIVVGGDMTAEIVAGPRADLSASNIDLIQVGGDVYSSISAEHGIIDTIDIAGSIIGSEVPIDTDGLMSLAADSMDANITVSGPINRIETRTGGFFGVIEATTLTEDAGVADEGIFLNGPFAGILFVGGDVTVPISIDGDFEGEFFVVGDLAIGPSKRGDVTISGSYTSMSQLNLISGSIETNFIVGDGISGNRLKFGTALYTSNGAGQIIFNANNSSSTWDADVVVDLTTLSPKPAYAQEDLIGAVGQVPFLLHNGDCVPENGDTFAFNDGLVILRFYGPVTWDEGFPFNISWCPGGSSCDPVSENARWMVVSGQGTRTITLQYVDTSQTPAEIPSGRNYTIIPVLTGANKLLCDKLLTTSDVVVADFEYTFSTP